MAAVMTQPPQHGRRTYVGARGRAEKEAPLPTPGELGWSARAFPIKAPVFGRLRGGSVREVRRGGRGHERLHTPTRGRWERRRKEARRVRGGVGRGVLGKGNRPRGRRERDRDRIRERRDKKRKPVRGRKEGMPTKDRLFPPLALGV